MIKALLFDLDNTIIDFWKMKKMSVDAAVRAMKDAGLEMEHDKATKMLYGFYEKLGYEYQYIFERFLKKAIGRVDWKMLANAVVAYRKVRAGFMEPYPGVTRTLLKLRQEGYKLGIVTDAPRLKAWIRLTSMNLDDFFDTVVCFEDTKQQKPNSLPFEKALKNLAAKPDEVLMVGDNIERDIKGAKKLGIRTCFARYGYVQKFISPKKGKVESGADFEIDRFEDIFKALKNEKSK